MIVKLLTEHHLEFGSLKGGCRGLSESTFVKLFEISCHGSYPLYSLQCPEEKKDASKRSFEEEDNKKSMMTEKYQMMDIAVQPMTLMPHIHEMNERYGFV